VLSDEEGCVGSIRLDDRRAAAAAR